MKNDRVIVGKIRKCFGLEGEVFIESLSHSLSRFRKLRKVYLGLDEINQFETEVVNCKINGEKIILKFSSFNNIADVQKFTGSFIFVDPDDSIRPPDGRFFQHELIGLKIVDSESNYLGSLKEILSLPAYDVYVVDFQDKDVLVPAIPEFIEKINLEKKEIQIKMIDGLFDL